MTIYDDRWLPMSESEYHQRLLANTILLVKAAGGRLVIPRELIEDTESKGHVVRQDRNLNTGDVTVWIEQTPLPPGV